MTVTPIFLLSLPRSGSTLVQRVIGAHAGVSTASEPWILLPLLGPLQPEMTMQDAWQEAVALAVEDFTKALPGGQDEYLEATRDLALRLYERSSAPGSRFFLDKTPHYYLVVDLILRAFPDARFVFLWRNPLSILSSLVETFGDGRWRMARYRLQLFHGLHDLVRSYDAHRDRVHAVRFEDLLAGEDAWRDMMAYIGVDFAPDALTRFSEVKLGGRMQDPTGTKRYKTLSSEPVDKWRATIGNPVRIAWCRRYLHWLGPERLATMGYDLDELLAQLDAIEVSPDGMWQDVVELVNTAGREIWRARMPSNRLVSSWRVLASAGSRR
jgi:hypothetical protein